MENVGEITEQIHNINDDVNSQLPPNKFGGLQDH